MHHTCSMKVQTKQLSSSDSTRVLCQRAGAMSTTVRLPMAAVRGTGPGRQASCASSTARTQQLQHDWPLATGNTDVRRAGSTKWPSGDVRPTTPMPGALTPSPVNVHNHAGPLGATLNGPTRNSWCMNGLLLPPPPIYYRQKHNALSAPGVERPTCCTKSSAAKRVLLPRCAPK